MQIPEHRLPESDFLVGGVEASADITDFLGDKPKRNILPTQLRVMSQTSGFCLPLNSSVTWAICLTYLSLHGVICKVMTLQ